MGRGHAGIPICFLWAVLPSSLPCLSITYLVLQLPPVKRNHLETETCSSIKEHFGEERSREGKFMSYSHFLQTNEILITEMGSQVFASTLVMFGEQKWFGIKAVRFTFGWGSRRDDTCEGQRMSQRICDFLELPFSSSVFLDGGRIHLLVCSEDVMMLVLARIWKTHSTFNQRRMFMQLFICGL